MSSREIGDDPIGNYRTPVRAIVIANHADADGGAVTERLGEVGWSFEVWSREEAPGWPDLPPDVGLVVPLGSDWSVYWEDISAHVAAEAHLLRTAHNRGTPIFGICFGGQMLAHALGGHVERAQESEIGWFLVDSDPEMPTFWTQTPWFQWHYDRFVPPTGAIELARGAQGSQAFVIGRSLGLQFHPEITPAIVERWSSGAGSGELARLGLDPAALLAETFSHEHVSRESARRLVDWFVAHCSRSN
jgi:GMP synthase-like glutamine amidotransferase